MEADLLEDGYEVATANANIQLPILFHRQFIHNAQTNKF